MVVMFLPGNDIPHNDWLHINYFDKLVHAAIFGVMAFLFSWPVLKSALNRIQQQQYFLKVALAVSIWGLAAELIQKYFIPGRSYDIVDWIADTIGAFISLLILKKFFARPSTT
jgi:VanZ family protein